MKSKELQEVSGNLFSSQSSSSILNKIIFCGKNTKEVSIKGISFTLKTLSEKENRSIVDILLKAPEQERITFVRATTLALAVDKIDGTSFDELMKESLGAEYSSDQRFLMQKKAEIILSLQNTVVTTLYEEYEELISSTKDSLKEDEEIKNS